MAIFSWQTELGAKVLIDHLQDGIYVIENGKMAYVNQRMAEMLEYKVEELLGLSFIDLVDMRDQALVMERYRARLTGENVPQQYDIHLLTKHRRIISCALNVGLRLNENGQLSTIGSARDVTQKEIELAELEASQIELKAIFDHLTDVYYRTNMQGIITLISPSCYDVLGYRQEVMMGKPMADYYKSPEERQKIVQAITDGKGKATRVEAALVRKDGSIAWIATNAVVRLNKQGIPLYIEGVARDISDRKRMEEQLLTLTRIDALTGAYNRRYFMDRCDELFKVTKRYLRPSSILMMDLDHFKKINDTYGHHIGDQALSAFTKICQKEIRDSDVLGRLGGEEFGLMLPETNIQNAHALAERIRQSTAEILIPVADNIIRITVSIGLAEIVEFDQTLDDVLRRADGAMYLAKEQGRNRVITVYQ